MAKETYIIDGIRTPIGSFCGALSPVRTDDLLTHVLKGLAERHSGLDIAAIDDVIIGCANQAGEDNRNVARMCTLMAGYPVSVPAETVNRLCSSGMSAVVHAHRAIQAGDGELFISGGVEHMTRGPWVISKTSTPFGRDAKMYDSSFGWRFINPLIQQVYGTEAMGETAENLVENYGISRQRQDMFSYHSQAKVKKAREAGYFKSEILPIEVVKSKREKYTVDEDEFPRPDTTPEILAGLRPAFRKDGSVTAGNSSGLNDGAAALLIASGKAVKDHNLKPLARIVSSAVAGVEPRIMGIGPVSASQRALEKAGLTLSDIDIIELNEAFAAQVLACLDSLKIDEDDTRVNPQGGAIALGHPLGMTGSRILLTAALQLQRTGKRYALATMCIGVGQGYAVVLERAD